MVHPLIARGPFLCLGLVPAAFFTAYFVGVVLHLSTKGSRPTGNEFSGVQAAFPSGRPVGRKNVFTCTMIKSATRFADLTTELKNPECGLLGSAAAFSIGDVYTDHWRTINGTLARRRPPAMPGDNNLRRDVVLLFIASRTAASPLAAAQPFGTCNYPAFSRGAEAACGEPGTRQIRQALGESGHSGRRLRRSTV
jgi:hypothetical protein